MSASEKQKICKFCAVVRPTPSAVQGSAQILSALTFEITGIERARSQRGSTAGESPNQVQVKVPHKTVESPNSPIRRKSGETGFLLKSEPRMGKSASAQMKSP